MKPSMLKLVLKEMFQARENVMITGAPGIGKCLGKDTPILMADGNTKKVQDVQMGDSLMGPDSQPRYVTSIATGRAPMFRIRPLKGTPFVCNGEHILSLKMSGGRSQYTRTGQIKHLSVDEYITQNSTFKHRAKLWRVGIEMPSLPVPFDPYIIGVWIGDGRINAPSITVGQRKHSVRKWLEEWCQNNNYFLMVQETPNHEPELRIVNHHNTDKHPSQRYITNPLRTFLRDRCVVNHEKRIPPEYLRNDRTSRLRLLAGILDTDGYLATNCFDIVTKYPGLADDIVFLAGSVGLQVTHKTVRKNIVSSGFSANYERITISGDVACIPCLTSHRQAHERKQCKNPLVVGFTVEELGEDDYYGFTLDGDHHFLLGDFTVSHNTDVVMQTGAELGYKVQSMHPVVSDPTDMKGYLMVVGGQPVWVPTDELDTLINAREPLIAFLDDFGQATPAVQAAFMHPILARRINRFQISEHVRWVLASNRKTDRANVTGILEPVKSRMTTILELEVDHQDWLTWAIGAGMPVDVIAFVMAFPNLLHDFQPTTDLVNSPCPRTIAASGRLLNLNLPKESLLEVLTGSIGRGCAAQMVAFLAVRKHLPPLDGIIMNPMNAPIPEDNPSAMYAVIAGLAFRATDMNFGSMIQYCNRFQRQDFADAFVNIATTKKPELMNTHEFTMWAAQHQHRHN